MSSVLKVDNISKSFPSPDGKISVLKGISFSVDAGESVSIRGDSGTGKTTLLNIMSAIETADKGTVSWGGVATTGKSASWLAQRRGRFIGLVFQSYYLMPELNALDNVLIAGRLLGRISSSDKERAKALLVRVGLGERLKQISTRLSGGERQRVALARALMNKPELILADEPTGNLDENTGGGVMKLLLELCSEEAVSLVLVTHNPEYAAQTSRELHLSHGVM